MQCIYLLILFTAIALGSLCRTPSDEGCEEADQVLAIVAAESRSTNNKGPSFRSQL
jgi:hypothetical protein